MAPSLELNEDVSKSLPVKVVETQPKGVIVSSGVELEDADIHDLTLRVFRAYISDLCQQFGGGHPG